MINRTATIDTPVLLSLQCAGMIGAVSVLFNRILVPCAVRKEIVAGGERNQAAADALTRFAIFVPCDDYEAANVRLLLDDRTNREAGEDQGEAEAVVQAAQHAAHMVLVDDALGRRWAEDHGLDCHGTLWIFDELRARGFIGELQPLFHRLIQGRRRQPLDLMNALLRKYEELEITSEDFLRLSSC